MSANEISAGVAVNLGLELQAFDGETGEHGRPVVFKSVMEKHLVRNGLVPRKW